MRNLMNISTMLSSNNELCFNLLLHFHDEKARETKNCFKIKKRTLLFPVTEKFIIYLIIQKQRVHILKEHFKNFQLTKSITRNSVVYTNVSNNGNSTNPLIVGLKLKSRNF